MAPPRRSTYVPLPGSRRVLPPHTTRVRGCRPNEKIVIDIHVRRPEGAVPVPSIRYWMSHPPGHRRYLDPAQFESLHGASVEDLERVQSFCQSQKLKVDQVYPGRRTLTVSGTAAEMNSAFHVDLGYYRSLTQTYRGRVGEIYIPRGLESVITAVIGLEKRPMQRERLLSKPAGLVEQVTSDADKAFTIDPITISSFYGFPDGDGAGQTVGIIELAGGYIETNKSAEPADLRAFMTKLNLPCPTVVSVSAGAHNLPAGSRGHVAAGDPDVEVALDIALAAAVAPAAKLVVYFAQNSVRGFITGVAAAVHDKTNRPTVLSISWALAESLWTAANRKVFQQLLRDAAALGLTVLVSSGDDGTNAGSYDGRPHVNYPASDPWVIACGGTSVKRHARALTEQSWKQSGGGFSRHWKQPSWQSKIPLPSEVKRSARVGRGIPDVAGNAGTGYELIVYGMPTTRLRLENGNGSSGFVGPVTGTSAVSPLYAGLIARINSRFPQPVGYLNPLLYSLGLDRRKAIFRKPVDRTKVSNSYTKTFSDPKTGKPVVFSTPGFVAEGIWNPVVGFGSIHGKALKHELDLLYSAGAADFKPSANLSGYAVGNLGSRQSRKERQYGRGKESLTT